MLQMYCLEQEFLAEQEDRARPEGPRGPSVLRVLVLAERGSVRGSCTHYVLHTRINHTLCGIDGVVPGRGRIQHTTVCQGCRAEASRLRAEVVR